MRHAIYEDPATGKFAVIRMPPRFVDGDKLPIPPTARWLDTREDAIATLRTLFDQEEDGA